MHLGIRMISVRIWGFVCDQSQYAYGESYNPRMHTGTVIIPPRMHKVIAGVAISVYSRGCPYAYCESPYAYNDTHTHVHSGLILNLQHVRESNNDYWLMTTSFYYSLQQLHSNSFFLVIQATLIVPVAARAAKSTSFLTSTAV